MIGQGRQGTELARTGTHLLVACPNPLQWRWGLCLFLLLGATDILEAHRAEPISTEFALPFQPKSGNWKLVYEYARKRMGTSEHAVPEMELELGVAPRLQDNAAFPVLRIKEAREEPATVVGGKLELGGRYLLFGGAVRKYAVSLQGTVEAPTGNRSVVGDAPELGVGLFTDRYLSDRLRVHSNLSWQTTVGGSHERERVFRYNHAVVWFATLRWIPVFELLGATNTATGRTAVAAQPEVIYYLGPHFELKAGVPVGLTSTTPRIGLRAQLAVIWGGSR